MNGRNRRYLAVGARISQGLNSTPELPLRRLRFPEWSLSDIAAGEIYILSIVPLRRPTRMAG